MWRLYIESTGEVPELDIVYELADHAGRGRFLET
jgi:hypothetical protein